MSEAPLFVPLRVASAFLLGFLWLFLPHRYGRAASAAIVLVSYGLTGFLEAFICRHITQSIDARGMAVLAAEMLITLCTAMLLGEHRDSRSLFVGLSACTCALSSIILGSLIYWWVGNPALALTGQAGFNACTVAVFYSHNKQTPLTELLADRKGRARLCFIPLTCFFAIFASSIWPGNIFTDPACRPISAMLLVLLFLSYRLVMELLRAQERDNWLRANNEILNAYAHGLKQQIERTAKEQEALAVIRHDIRHRANLVQYYLSEGNTEAVREMVARVNAQLDATVERRWCADTALNWVLNSTAQRAEERQIRFECSADIPPLPEAKELEFGTIVLNLLENAYNAAERVPERGKRFIRVSVQPVKGQVFLRVDNAYCGMLKFSPSTGLPVLQQGEGHGYGLRSVLAFAQAHQATLDCAASEGVFHARLLIPLPKKL